MTWIAALAVGAGLGLVFVGGLWLTVRLVVREPRAAILVPISGLVRVLVLGAGFALLSRSGAGLSLVALVGFWLVRWYLVRRLTEAPTAV